MFNPDHCWYKLDIDSSNAINSSFKWPTPQRSSFGIWRIADLPLLLNQNILDKFYHLGLTVPAIMLFWRKANLRDTEAHVDVQRKDLSRPTGVGLNIVLKGKDSEMLWFEKPRGDLEISWTDAKTPYVTWPIKQLRQIDKAPLGMEITLVRVDAPHAVNCGNEERWCISARLDRPYDSWDEAVKFFDDRKLLIHR